MRSLILDGDTYIMGRPNEYRWMPKDIFMDGDVKVIYQDNVAYLASWLELPRVIVIRDATIAQENRRVFEYFWAGANGPQSSSSQVFYEG